MQTTRMGFRSTRLVIARQRRRVTRQALADATGIKARVLSEIEAGERDVSTADVDSFAAALRFPRQFFYASDDLDLVEPGRVSFRALASMSARLRDAVLASASIAFAVNRRIEEDFELPELDLPDFTGENPAQAAAELRSHWNIGLLAIDNVVHLLESKGIRVFSLAEDCREVDAFAVWNDGTPFVFLNTIKSAEHGRWDAAHELGHLLLHRGRANKGPEAEDEANRFAAAFLMPATEVRSLPGMPTPDDLLQYKKNWGVSAVALARRQRDVGTMPSWYYERLMIELSRRGWRRFEPDGLPRETSQVFAQVLSSWQEEDGLTQSAIAMQLNLHVDELAGLLFGRILHGVQGAAQPQLDPNPPGRANLRIVR